MLVLDESMLERAAIYEFDAGFSREKADRIVKLEAMMDKGKTLTKQQYEVLKRIREEKGL